jgi:hypothetical protein
MGLIKSIFGLIGGLVKAIIGLVGIGKKSEFYMELNEADSGSPAQAAEPEAKPAAKSVAKPAAAPVAPASTVEKSAPAPMPTPVAVVAPPKPAAPAAPVPSFAANYLMTAGPSLPRRRRPGPSMSSFKDMAKQMNGR